MTDNLFYKNIAQRTGGDIYIGVVGPVRTGKSTFIKQFMELHVLPMMADGPAKERAIDEMPLSAGGKMVTTSEPKFIPKEAVHIEIDDAHADFRLIDCVGYTVDGTDNSNDAQTERMVKTPWLDYEIPFSKAAEIGTYKVIHDHSQIGVVVTTDGSFGEIDRNAFITAEEKTIDELKKINKPFIIILNSAKPYAKETRNLMNSLENKYNHTVLSLNCLQMKKDDTLNVLEKILDEFPIVNIDFYMPSWIDMLESNHPIKKDLIDYCRIISDQVVTVSDIKNCDFTNKLDFIENTELTDVDLSKGCASVRIDFVDQYYYEILSDMVGVDIEDEYDLIEIIKSFAQSRNEYKKVTCAVEDVRAYGYGVVTPGKDEISLDSPTLIRHGNRFGVRIHATSPSIHMIRADIETEIAPIVGSEAQAQDLIEYIKSSNDDGTIWETSIFGKTIEQMVDDGIETKVTLLNDECRTKLQDTMKKIVNENNGGMVCIII